MNCLDVCNLWRRETIWFEFWDLWDGKRICILQLVSLPRSWSQDQEQGSEWLVIYLYTVAYQKCAGVCVQPFTFNSDCMIFILVPPQVTHGKWKIRVHVLFYWWSKVHSYLHWGYKLSPAVQQSGSPLILVYGSLMSYRVFDFTLNDRQLQYINCSLKAYFETLNLSGNFYLPQKYLSKFFTTCRTTCTVL